ncbi:MULTISPECIES: hypothetical protein [Massilia]|uniref:hypothetical protein n=1 Tax=Massilia TaxID=149698 RepID=UPI000F2DDF97|nr:MULTISPECIES: hypothetical protein [Massilia]MDY0961921.1 hypothetical protein [Massilia sp. CFBP9026]
MDFKIRVNQFTDGATGHTNITLIGPSGQSYTYGANVSPSAGVQNEHAQTMIRISNNPSAYSYSDVVVSESTFNRVLEFAQAADAGNNSYSIFCNNCVDFVDRALVVGGGERFSAHQYFKDGTLLDAYSKLSEYVCDPGNVSAWSTGGSIGLKQGDQFMHGISESLGSGKLYQGPNFFEFFNNLKNLLGASSADAEVKANEDYVYENAPTPLIVDLNGDGARTISAHESQVFFDTVGDGIARKTGWVDQADAFLVQDSNSNGAIDDITELFGGSGRAAGFKKLATLDSNSDGYITASDSAYDTLLLWKDSNSDGISNPDELILLAEIGLTSIDLAYETVNIYDNGNFIGETSTVTIAGQSAQIGDAYLSHAYAYA